jgi:hypothetical protein
MEMKLPGPWKTGVWDWTSVPQTVNHRPWQAYSTLKVINSCKHYVPQHKGSYTDPLKMWQYSNIWKSREQVKVAFMTKLRAD